MHHFIRYSVYFGLCASVLSVLVLRYPLAVLPHLPTHLQVVLVQLSIHIPFLSAPATVIGLAYASRYASTSLALLSTIGIAASLLSLYSLLLIGFFR